MMSILFLALSVGFSASAQNLANQCETGEQAIYKYEKQSVDAFSTTGVAPSDEMLGALECLVHNFKISKGFLKNIAHSSLEAVLSAQRDPNLIGDPIYKKLAKFLTEMSEEDKALRELVLNGYAKGMSDYYKLFCSKEDSENCARMLPGSDLILGQADLISAGSVFLIKRVYSQSDKATRDQLKSRVKELYERTSNQVGLKRQVIEEAYEEIFGKQIPLSLRS